MSALKTDAKWTNDAINDNVPRRLRKKVWEGNVCVGAIEYRMRAHEDGAKECVHVAFVFTSPTSEMEVPGSRQPSMYGSLTVMSNFLK